MHCSTSENQTYTGLVIFGVEYLKSLKGQENLLLKNLAKKQSEFCHGGHFLWERMVFKVPTKWLLKGL